jgi:hypothetical protein
MEDVEAIGTSVHLGEKATMVILDSQASISTCKPFSSSCPKLMMEFLSVGM